MVAYFLTFVIMLTFLDHSRIWYVGFFHQSTCFGHAKRSCHDTYFRVDRHKSYIFWLCRGGELCGRLYYSIRSKHAEGGYPFKILRSSNIPMQHWAIYNDI